MDRVGDVLCQHIQRHIPQTECRSHMNPGLIRSDQTGDRDADPEKLLPVYPVFFQKRFQTFCKRAVFRFNTGDKVERNRLKGKLVQAQICQGKTELSAPDGDTDGNPRQESGTVTVIR